MKSSKSVNSLNAAASQQQQQQQQIINGSQTTRRPPPESTSGGQRKQAASSNAAPTSPICRCRVLYLGSSVPHITKDGLQGIQEPLRELYPDKASLGQANAGIDSWLSVWSNGILVENVDETGREVKRFFKIEALHYCAAVKFVPQAGNPMNGAATLPHNHLGPASGSSSAAMPKFLPLDSPHARMQQDDNTNPPIFASILRRTTGVKVLECHAFICKREAAANALVRCCFHAYADTMYAKQIGAEIDSMSHLGGGQQNESDARRQDTLGGYAAIHSRQPQPAPAIAARRSKSIAALNDVADSANELTSGGEFSDSNSKHRQYEQDTFQGAVLRRRSLNNGQQQLNYINSGDISDSGASQQGQHLGYDNSAPTNNLQSQKYNSKSMHQLNQAHLDSFHSNFLGQNGGLNQHSSNNQSTSFHNLAKGKFESPAEQGPPLFNTHNPYTSRVPSYPPQHIIDQQQQQQQQHMHMQTIHGGTLRSVKSVAANSIASTLLRSKKHAKAMSMAQLNQQQQQLMNQQHQQNPITSFHQHANQGANGPPYGGSFMTLPPVPPMFLPNMPRHINGSQTLKLPSRHMLPQMAGQPPFGPMNFEAMTPKEMKKLLKKSAKYGLDPSKFAENGLPLLPLRPIQMPLPPHLQQAGALFNAGGGGTLNSTTHSMHPMDSSVAGAQDMTDSMLANGGGVANFGPPPPMFLPPPPPPEHLMGDPSGCPPQPIKSILVKPNPEFLKSKAGKKWLKQQKEFKKLLPSHLDGLPIVFGPPPIMDMMEPVNGPMGSSASSTSSMSQAPPPPGSFLHAPPPPPPPLPSQLPGVPILDSNGYYNPHPLYGQSGRASAASTLMRNSPQIMKQLHEDQIMDQHHHQMMMQQRNHQKLVYSNPVLMMGQQYHQHAPPPPPLPPMLPPHLQASDAELCYERSPASHLGPYDRQFAQPANSSSRRRPRNHMVEQSVISLGDEENEGEEDEEADGDGGNEMRRRDDLGADERDNDERSGGQFTNGYYDQADSSSNGARHRHHRRSRGKSSSSEQQQEQIHQMSSGEHMAGSYQDDYEQISAHQQQASEDRNSNSSGIYRRRGHMNERAFSYSIRQEASKSSADNSDAEYRNGELSDSNYHSNNNNHIDYHMGQQQQMQQQHHNVVHYENPLQQGNTYQSRPPIQYYKQHPSQQHPSQQPVDELTARLENQLNMKSYGNSGVKSHM